MLSFTDLKHLFTTMNIDCTGYSRCTAETILHVAKMYARVEYGHSVHTACKCYKVSVLQRHACLLCSDIKGMHCSHVPRLLTLFSLLFQQLSNIGQALVKGVFGLWVEVPVGDVDHVLGILHGMPHVKEGVCLA